MVRCLVRSGINPLRSPGHANCVLPTAQRRLSGSALCLHFLFLCPQRSLVVPVECGKLRVLSSSHPSYLEYNRIHCFYLQYGLVLGVLFVTQILLSLSMVWLKQQLLAKFNAHRVDFDDATINMNFIQSSLNCCGIQGLSDWTTIHLAVPGSCCLAESCDTRFAENLWSQGCHSQMSSFMDNNLGVMSLLVLSFSAVSLMGVFCSFSFAKRFSSTYEIIY